MSTSQFAESNFAGQTFGIYPRVSTMAQAADDKDSLDAQIEAAQEYGEDLGMVLDPLCVRKEAHTSTTMDRPELNALLRDMRQRKVRNLVIDRADRLTREGIMAAFKFLIQFTDAGITLHVVMFARAIRTEEEIKRFLDDAYAAQQANEDRTRARMMAMKRAAKRGKYTRGSYPTYGFLDEPVEWNVKGHPTKFRKVRDLRDIGGFRPWEIRQLICREYLAGYSTRRIADRLTADGVPTSGAVLRHRDHSDSDSPPPSWARSTIREMLADSINKGVYMAFRTTWEWADPDERHPTRWKRTVHLPVDKRITVGTVVADDAIILTEDEYQAVLHRLETARQQSARNSGPAAFGAMLHGALGRCPHCGGGLRVKPDKRPNRAPRYLCNTHESQSRDCPQGFSAPVPEVDAMVWAAMQEKLLTPGALEELAERQAKADLDGEPDSKLGQLQRLKKKLDHEREGWWESLRMAEKPTIKAGILNEISKLDDALADADREIAEHEAISRNAEWRRKLLGDVASLITTYSDLIRMLDTRHPIAVRYCHAVCHTLGVQATIDRDADGLKADLEFMVNAASAQPWFHSGEFEVIEDPVTGKPTAAVTMDWQLATEGIHNLTREALLSLLAATENGPS